MKTVTVITMLLAMAACSPDEGAAKPIDVSGVPQTASFQVMSTDIADGTPLALGHVYNRSGCVGSNRSPALSWEPVQGALSYAVTVFDPDAPGGGWWHWLVANIPADTTTLVAGAGGRIAPLPEGVVQGRNDFGETGYGGPCPPPGDTAHRYVFTVHALSVPRLDVDALTSGAAFKLAVDEFTLAKATLTATYAR